MKTQQATPTLRYRRTFAVDEPVEPGAGLAGAGSETSGAVAWATWGVLAVCLAGWAVVGFFLWIPRVLRTVLVFSAGLVQSTVTETSTAPAGRRLTSAANFYKRGFVGAVEAIRPSQKKSEEVPADDSEEEGWSLEPRLIVNETGWAFLVWYAIVWPTGLLRGTPADVAALPWSEIWSGFTAAAVSIPGLFGG